MISFINYLNLIKEKTVKTLISVKKLNALVVNSTDPENANENYALTGLANILPLGYSMDAVLLAAIGELSVDEITETFNDLINVLRKLKGSDVDYTPMYPNFPQQVIEASHAELFLNAIAHYWTFGEWKPNYDKLPREFAFENVNFQKLSLVSENEFKGIFTKLLGSAESLSSEDVKIIEWFMENYSDLEYPETIPYKENMCVVAGISLKKGNDISKLVGSATDVLRIATYLSDGDISLATKTKYKSFPRPIRRILVNALENVISEEDIARHSGKWVRLAHSLHVGEYSSKVWGILRKVRENETIITFNSRVEQAILSKNMKDLFSILSERPGEYARRLDKILRINDAISQQRVVINNFMGVAHKVPTRVLLQLIGHFQNRAASTDHRVVFPKGSVQNAMVIDGQEGLAPSVVNKLLTGIRNILVDRFKTLEPLGKTFIHQSLDNCPVPTQQRSASSGLLNVARGTRLPIGDDKSTLRFFIYWKGQDIDLSTTFYDENFNGRGHVSYTRLTEHGLGIYHSGDITWAPNGACEFIDVSIDDARKSGVRYIAMNVLVYSGPTFSEHETCYAGWMTREHPGSNEIFDPKTVMQKIDVTSDTRNVIPVIFDLKTREAIWADLSTGAMRDGYYGNNVESNRASISQTVTAIISNTNKVSLYDLFSMHVAARGTVVDNKDEADTVFSLYGGDVTPYDINTIQSEYVI